MIPYQKILAEAPANLRKRLAMIDALATHTAQDHCAARSNCERSGPTIRETYPELAALWQWLILKYSADQPRVPAGSRDGGQWTKGDDKPGVQYAGNGEDGGDETSDAASFPTQKYGKGHHWISRGVYDDYNLKPETRRVFETSTSGPLADPSVNSWSQEHIEYIQAVKEHFDDFLKRNKITAEQMTPDQASELVDEVRRSSDPRIRTFRMKIERESLRYFRRYGPRGGGRGSGGGDEE